MASLTIFRRPAAALAALCLTGSLATGCDGGDGGAPAAGPSVVAVAEKAPGPETRCGATLGGVKVVMPAGGGVKIYGARYGSGSHGVVLVHQRGSDLCGWASFIPELLDRGLQVLAIDLRCNGYSDCPADDSGDDLDGSRDYVADAGAAVAELHRAGATKVAVMGASLGAATALVTGGRYPDQVSAVVALSLFNAGFPVSQSDIRTATDAAPHITAPILICLSTGDGGSIQEGAADTLIDASPAKADGDTVVLDGSSHGWDMLATDQTVAAKVLDFLTRHT
jgi:dienelactone hydrolase